MMAFDTDVLPESLMDNPVFVARAATIPRHEQAVPVVVIEAILWGRLQVSRHAEAEQVVVRITCCGYERLCKVRRFIGPRPRCESTTPYTAQSANTRGLTRRDRSPQC
jgi:uncharacterized membrane protein